MISAEIILGDGGEAIVAGRYHLDEPPWSWTA
jgi:hypothetical protein